MYMNSQKVFFIPRRREQGVDILNSIIHLRPDFTSGHLAFAGLTPPEYSLYFAPAQSPVNAGEDMALRSLLL